MSNPIGIHSQLAAEAARQHRPEGVSVLVEGEITARAVMDAATAQYPDTKLTGTVLFVGPDELGDGRHEVVLEVA